MKLCVCVCCRLVLLLGGGKEACTVDRAKESKVIKEDDDNSNNDNGEGCTKCPPCFEAHAQVLTTAAATARLRTLGGCVPSTSTFATTLNLSPGHVWLVSFKLIFCLSPSPLPRPSVAHSLPCLSMSLLCVCVCVLSMITIVLTERLVVAKAAGPVFGVCAPPRLCPHRHRHPPPPCLDSPLPPAHPQPLHHPHHQHSSYHLLHYHPQHCQVFVSLTTFHNLGSSSSSHRSRMHDHDVGGRHQCLPSSPPPPPSS